MYSVSRLSRLLIERNIFGMQTRSQSYKFTHHAQLEEFHLHVGGSIAKVEYTRDGDVLDLDHSEVPASLRGKGIGEILAKSTFDYINENDLKMKVTCGFLRKVYEENKNQYVHLIED